ncbi:hypothetical protein ACFL1Y_00275 [Patescibacteria group bacterium]
MVCTGTAVILFFIACTTTAGLIKTDVIDLYDYLHDDHDWGYVKENVLSTIAPGDTASVYGFEIVYLNNDSLNVKYSGNIWAVVKLPNYGQSEILGYKKEEDKIYKSETKVQFLDYVLLWQTFALGIIKQEDGTAKVIELYSARRQKNWFVYFVDEINNLILQEGDIILSPITPDWTGSRKLHG